MLLSVRRGRGSLCIGGVSITNGTIRCVGTICNQGNGNVTKANILECCDQNSLQLRVFMTNVTKDRRLVIFTFIK